MSKNFKADYRHKGIKMIVDCIMFFNELDLLEARLKYLDDLTKYVVIVESNVTFSGNPKPLYFAENISKFGKYMDKILYLPFVPDLTKYDFTQRPNHLDYSIGQWRFEADQRQTMVKAFNLFPEQAFVLMSDLDEIPAKSALQMAIPNINPTRPAIAFEQSVFYYNFDKIDTGNKIKGSVLTTTEYAIKMTPQWFRDHRQQLASISNAGWHLSYFSSPEKIQYKIQNFSHQEYNKDEYTNLDKISDRINQHTDLFGRNYSQFEDFDKTSLPAEVLELFGPCEYHLSA